MIVYLTKSTDTFIVGIQPEPVAGTMHEKGLIFSSLISSSTQSHPESAFQRILQVFPHLSGSQPFFGTPLSGYGWFLLLVGKRPGIDDKF
jgi:hypothetical protein